jgi:hypothetical protein
MKSNATNIRTALVAVWTIGFVFFGALSLNAQDPAAPDPAPVPVPAPVTAEDASLTAEVNENGGRIVLEAKGIRHEVPMLFSADARETIEIKASGVTYEIGLQLKVIQGKAKVLSFGLGGSGDLQSVTGEGLTSWSVRRTGKDRFLDLQVGSEADRKEFTFLVRARIAKQELPASPDLLHLKAGSAVGFTSALEVKIPAGISSRLVAADGFLPLESESDQLKRYEGSLGKRLAFAFSRSSAVSAPVELLNAWLEGTVDEKGGYTSFLFRGTAVVTKGDAVLDILHGRAAASDVPVGQGYQLELVADKAKGTLYRLRFLKAGSYPVELKIVARHAENDEWKNISFEVPSGAIVPIVLRGIAGETEFRQNAGVIPSKEGEAWRGFLPLHGRCEMGWKPVRKTGEGKLFFATAARVNVGVGAGLLRQTSIVDYKILQGKLEDLSLELEGPGEVLEVDGANVLGWKVVTVGAGRTLEVRLSRPIEDSGGLRVRSQLALGAFPVRAKPLRLVPTGSIRHSGYIRVYNIGATSIEVVGATGLTQLSPDQFPEKNLPGGDRQVFVYRFPAAAHDYEISADRVQPEVTVSQNVVYGLSESDRTIDANVELDIREAPLREWDLIIPSEGYSVVSVSGAEVADYVVGSLVENDERTLKVLFAKNVIGRQLIALHLEKNQAAEAGEWVLPRVRNPEAKSVRGEIGTSSVPGFRFVVGATEKLREIPISRFQMNKPDLHLQQAFRVRERDWSATLKIERLPQSVQADVFHLYSLKDETAYVSVVLNYFITGAPVSEFRLGVPMALVKKNEDDESYTILGNLSVVCNDLRQQKLVVGEEGPEYVLTLQKGVIGPVTLLVTYELPLPNHGEALASINLGELVPKNVASERGFIQVVSPEQVNEKFGEVSKSLLKLDPQELPAEFRLLSSAPPLGTYQYSGSARPFKCPMTVAWFDAGETVEQVVEYLTAETEVSRDGGVKTKVVMMVKTRGRRVLKTELPKDAKLWAVSVNGRSVPARTDVQDDGTTTKTLYLIPLPPEADVNTPVRVQLEVAKPAKEGAGKYPVVTLPTVSAPILKADWKIVGDKGRVLVPRGSTLPLGKPVLTETGLEWISNRAINGTLFLFVLLAAGLWVRRGPSKNIWIGLVGIGLLVVALIVSLSLVKEANLHQRGHLHALEFSLPVIAAGEAPTMVVANLTEWGAQVNMLGVIALIAGVGLIGWSLFATERRYAYRLGGGLFLAVGLLMQGGGASIFYLVVAIVIGLLLLPWIFRWWGQFQRMCEAAAQERKEEEARKEEEKSREVEVDPDGSLPGSSAATLLLFGLMLALGGVQDVSAQEKGKPEPVVIPSGMRAADIVRQDWMLEEGRLKVTGQLQVTGKPGDTYLLLKAPGVLTDFKGERLRVTKRTLPGVGAAYVVSIRQGEGNGEAAADAETFKGTFAYEMQVGENVDRFPVPTGPGAVQEVKVRYDQSGWEFDSAAAMRVSAADGLPAGGSGADMLLAPFASVEIIRRPKERDVKAEKTQFFTEVANLFMPSPGVIDGVHRLGVRPSQGEVSELSLTIPEGFTVSEVGNGPVGEWNFDAEARVLKIVIEPAQADAFSLDVATQSSLAPLPADAVLAPVVVSGAAGEVGLVALAFGPDAQPEKTVPDGLSVVNLTDFNANMIPPLGVAKPVLHRVYRYGQAGGSLVLRVAAVAPELRVTSKQVLSIGDERLVLSVDFVVDITRAGIFQTSFPLPEGLEVDSSSSSAQSHWTELTENDVRFVILHLNGKTIGKHQFHLTLSGVAPAPGSKDWLVPRFEIRESQRHTGTLVINPTTGVRLDPKPLRNVTDVAAKEIGSQGENALGFRLLQNDWELRLGVTKDQARVAADVLHTLTLREGQTKSSILANVRVERASIRSLLVHLPGLSEAEQKSLRSSGASVHDLVRVVDEGKPEQKDLWEVQFKRRVLGNLRFRIEWERTGERKSIGGRGETLEQLTRVFFPTAQKNSDYYIAVRHGAHMELSTPKLPKGWQRGDWTTVNRNLRDSGDRSAPARVFKITSGESSLEMTVQRHSVAEALKLRVKKGVITTVVSPVANPLGKRLTSVEIDFEVIQRSKLQVRLNGGRLLNAFVNGESVDIVRIDEAYQFYILPGADDRSAKVSFVYLLAGQKLGKLKLESPKLNVPMENIEWQVIVPSDFTLVKHGGDLDFEDDQIGKPIDLDLYLAKAEQSRQTQRRFAFESLEKASELITAGDQTKARILLNSAANNYALDAATNEDARIQLTNVQQRQAMVGLITRQHRLYRDNRADDPGLQAIARLERGATHNPIIARGGVRFDPQEYTNIVQANTEADNKFMRVIASRLIDHQRLSEPAAQAINLTIPDEGRIYTFSRSVQVEEDAPLGLELKFESPRIRSASKEAFVLILVFGICVALIFGWKRKTES